MHLEIRHLQLVAAVADEGSLTKAGERLNLTQSALSHQLLDIEQRLATPLFHRVSKRMILTPAGERVLASARRVLEDLRRTEEELQLLAGEQRGLLRVTTECYTCYHWLPSLLGKFEKKHPGVDVRIDVNATKRTTAALLDATIDLAIMSSEIDDTRLVERVLFEDEMVAIVAPGHPFASKECLGARELASETLLTYSTLDDSTAYQRVLRPAGLEPKRWMEVPLTEAMVELVRGGIGIAVLPRWSVWPQIEAGAIVAVPVTRRSLIRTWKAVTLRAARTPAYVDDFIDLLEKQPARQRNLTLHLADARRGRKARHA
ncbi:MAG: transcriptional regulator, LysR family [Acidobacteria bacterium]|nr:transcriptional regulator, LysR family [Acidobacteriota bacterium]